MKNKDFIPYQESLELKKLGFDEPCFFAFDNCSTPMRCSDLRTSEQKFNGVNYNSSSYTSQPAYPQAFRWFREKYNIRIGIDYRTNDKDGYLYNISWEEWANGENPPVLVWHHRNSWLGANEPLTSYEEAELACLRKLIQIVKQGGKQ